MSGKVSIIVPVFNSENTIQKCLSSLAALNYRNKEIIAVFDKWTTDNSLKLVQKTLKNKAYKLVFSERTTPSMARNLGAKRSSGEYVLFADADTVYPSNFLNETLPYFSEKKVGGIMAKKRVLNENENSYVKSKANDLKTRIDKNYIPFTAWLFKKSVFKKIGGYSNQIYYFAEDVELASRLRKAGYKIRYANDAVWYEIERSTVVQDYHRYFRRGMSLAISKYPSYMKNFSLKIILGSFYYSLLILIMPFLPYVFFTGKFSFELMIFYLPFVFVLSRYTISSFVRTRSVFSAIFYKSTALIRGLGMFTGFAYAKLLGKNANKKFLSR